MVDSSVAIKWFVDEPRRSEAKSLLGADQQLISPDLCYAEVANVLWRKVRLGEIEFSQASSALTAIPSLVELVRPLESLMRDALRLAAEVSHSVYDCVFLALAMGDADTILITDDAVFANKAATAGYADKIRLLADGPMNLAFSDSKLRELMRLFQQSKATIDSVASQVSSQFGSSGLAIYSTGDLQPAFDSPSYLSLKREIGSLSPHQTATLLAIAWLGRGVGTSDLETLYAQASHLASNPAQHAPYIISQLNYLERGIARLADQRSDGDAIPDRGM